MEPEVSFPRLVQPATCPHPEPHITYHNEVYIQLLCSFVLLFLYLKKKATPLQAWTGPEGSRSLRLPDLKTFGT